MDTPENAPSVGEAQDQSSLLVKSASGATFLILLQIGSRALTFAANQILLRFSSPELLGISTQLEVYSISVLVFSREALRVAIQRQTDSLSDDNKSAATQPDSTQAKAARKAQELVNLAYVSISLGVIFSAGLAWAFLKSLSNSSIPTTPYFQQALVIFGVSSLLELVSEPCFVIAQHKSLYKIRASVESIATLLRCLVTCVTAVLASRRGSYIGVLPFALGQLIYGIAVPVLYLWHVQPIASNERVSLLLRKIGSGSDKEILYYLPRPLLKLGGSLFIQGLIKHVLTQGDVFLISLLASTEVLGVYTLASNYGGLVARMVFQPIEETGRNYFGKKLSAIDGRPSKQAITSAAEDLQNLLKFYVILSICAASVGPTVAPLLVKLIAGPNWINSGAGSVLAKYCYYIPMLAINGITEAFVSSVASESALYTQSIWMIAFSAGFAVLGYLFLSVLDLGAEGLVWANFFNMTVRIMWSSNFIRRYFKSNGVEFGIRKILPTQTTIALGLCFAAAMPSLQAGFAGGMADLLKAAMCAFAFLILLILCERHFLLQCYEALKGKNH